MRLHPLDRQLLERLSCIAEVNMSGFSVRLGLTGAGVSVMRGMTFFGSWRVRDDVFVWVPAKGGGNVRIADSVDEATRTTMLLILMALQAEAARTAPEALAG
jgi:hypothetical protein